MPLGPGREIPNGLYQPAWPNLVAPFHPLMVNTTGAAGAINQMRGVRVVIPKTGILHDLAIFVGGTSSGNVIGAIYDTGDASPTNRTKLWDSGSVAAGTTNTWQVIADPALSLQAGQQVDLCLIADNTSCLFAGVGAVSSNQEPLPTNFWPAPGGAPPKFAWATTLGSFAAPSSIAESSLGASTPARLIIARIV